MGADSFNSDGAGDGSLRRPGYRAEDISCLLVNRLSEPTVSAIDSITTTGSLHTRVNLMALTNQKGSGRKEPTMIIIGCDYHPGFQQIAFVDTETGDCGEQRLEHCAGAEKFYRDLAAEGKKVRVGMEASGHARWFERQPLATS